MVVHAPSLRGYDYFETQVFNSTIKDNKEMVCLFNGITGEDTHFQRECLIPTGAKVGDVSSLGWHNRPRDKFWKHPDTVEAMVLAEQRQIAMPERTLHFYALKIDAITKENRAGAIEQKINTLCAPIVQEVWDSATKQWVHKTPLARDCVGDCYVVFCDPVFAKLVQDARTTRLNAQPVGKVTLEKALAAKDAELRSLRAQNEALTQCVFRQAAKFAAARAAHDAQLEEFHYVLDHFTKLSTLKPVKLRMGSQRSPLRYPADAGAMVVTHERGKQTNMRQ